MSVKDPQTFDPDTYKAALEHDATVASVRWCVTAAVIVLAILISGITYCGSQPSERMQCVTAGGSWMPVMAGHDDRGNTIYNDACVRPGMASLVPKGESK